MGRIGVWEILIIAIVLVVFFGAGKIANIGKGLGEGIKNFKKGLKESDDDDGAPKLPKDAEATKKGDA